MYLFLFLFPRRAGRRRTWSQIGDRFSGGLNDLEGTMVDQSSVWMVGPGGALAWGMIGDLAEPRMYRCRGACVRLLAAALRSAALPALAPARCMLCSPLGERRRGGTLQVP